MRSWTYTLAGLLIWSLHFAGVYAIASWGDVVARAEDVGYRLAALAFSAACLVAAIVVTVIALRRAKMAEEGAPVFMDQLAAMGGGVAVLAIAFQALPTLVGY